MDFAESVLPHLDPRTVSPSRRSGPKKVAKKSIPSGSLHVYYQDVSVIAIIVEYGAKRKSKL